MTVYTRTGYWLADRERRDELAASAQPLAYASMDEETLPDRVDPSSWLQTENQANQGACQGHSLSSGVEECHARAGGRVVQLSRAAAYYETQRIDGIRGDRGSTIAGGIKLAMGDGICSEQDWPYPSSYNPTRPPGYANTTRWKISGHSPIKSYDECIKHIGLHGPVHIGIMWGDDIDRQVSRGGILKTYRAGGGGHAILLAGYRDKDFQGNSLDHKHVILFNSWSERWGHEGECLVSKDAIEGMISNRMNVLEGLFGAPHPSIERPEFEDLDDA